MDSHVRTDEITPGWLGAKSSNLAGRLEAHHPRDPGAPNTCPTWRREQMGEVVRIDRNLPEKIEVTSTEWLSLKADEQGIRLLLDARWPRWVRQLRLLRQMRREGW